jgi:hypothetical protein
MSTIQDQLGELRSDIREKFFGAGATADIDILALQIMDLIDIAYLMANRIDRLEHELRNAKAAVVLTREDICG